MDGSLKSPFLCYFFVYRCRFAFMEAFVPNRMDFVVFLAICLNLACQLWWFAWCVLHRFIPLGQSSVVVCDFRIVFLNRLFAVRIRCGIYWIWDALVEINSKSQIISWCKERNPMWWLSLIPASCEEIGCVVRQCLFHLGTNPMWCGSPGRWTIVQSQPFFIRCHLVLCLLYRRYFVQCSSDLQIGFCLRFALSKSDAVWLNSLVRFPNRMLFAFGFLIADFNLHNRPIHVCKLDLGL